MTIGRILVSSSNYKILEFGNSSPEGWLHRLTLDWWKHAMELSPPTMFHK